MKKQLLIIFLLLIAKIIFAQSGTVTGTLADADGYGLPGVTIMIKGTTIGTITDLDGKYSIDCNVGETLVISFIGMETKEKIVTEDMFLSSSSNPIKRHKPIRKEPVQIIQNKAYSDLLLSNKIEQSGYFDMYSAPYQWSLSSWRNYRNNFYGEKFTNITESDSNFVFIEVPKPVYWEIVISSSVVSKSIINLPKLQSTYAQGRPNLGENTWFGAETNEQFAFGPKIENLVFDGSDYAYDTKGRLIPQNAQNQTSAKAYNPYDVLNKALAIKNFVSLSTQKNDVIVNLSYQNRKEFGIFESTDLQSDNFTIELKKRKNYDDLKIVLNYNNLQNEYVNSNALWTKTLSAIMLTPPTFDNSQGTVLENGNQRSSSLTSNNNPYFLLGAKGNSLKNNYFNTNLEYTYSKFYLNFGIDTKYDKNRSIENFRILKNTIGCTENYSQNEEINSEEFYLKLKLHSDYRRGFSFASTPVFSSEKIEFLRKVNDLSDLNTEKQRNSLNWSQSINYEPNFIQGMFLNLKNISYINSTQKQYLLPSLFVSYNFAEIIHNYKINTLKLYGNISSTVNEMPLYYTDKSYTTLNISPSQINLFVENNELFYNENLNLETRKSINLGINSYFFSNRLSCDIDYQNTISENSIFPVLNSDMFELQNIASIRNQSLELSIDYNYQFYYNYRFGWKTSLRFSAQRPVVKELYGENTQIPIAGFQTISKNLIENEPVGVIVGSAYLRNENGQMIIGTDGFPVVDDNLQILGNPNPDFKLFLENSFNIFGFITLNILLEYQQGGDIWNGTKNTLNYYGLSENSATERTITNYIFEGVNELGQVNSIPVDFANPADGLENNRWYRYGENGVAEDAIEDGSFFRIRELSILVNPLKNRNRFFRSLSINFYVQNLLTLSKYTGSSPNSYFNNYIQARGLDYFNIPETREIGLGIKIKI